MTIHFFVGLSREFGVISKYPRVDNLPNSHYLSALQCIRTARRVYILITPGSEWVKKLGKTRKGRITITEVKLDADSRSMGINISIKHLMSMRF